MSRVSFRLRRDTEVAGETVGVGSFTRGNSSWQGVAGVLTANQDADASLRARNLIFSSITTNTSYFEATAIEHTATKLSWSLTTIPSLQDSILLGQSGLIGIKVVRSSTGFPEAATDGVTVYEETNIDPTIRNIAIQTITDTNVPTGWVYYSLFGRYWDNNGGTGSYWYEKLASVETIIPTDYGSSTALWNRLPQYYRDNDSYGHLKKFIDIFGFEIDRTRSLIQSVMLGHDPNMAEAEGIDQLARLVGLEVGVNDVGVSRVRALLHDIGFLRRRKGTVSAIVGYLKALSGANATFAYEGSTWVAKVYAQRANLITDPRFVTSAGATWAVIQQSAGAATVTQTTNGITIATGATPTKIAIISKTGVPTGESTTYYMSFSAVSTGTATVYEGRLSATNTWSTWTGWTLDPRIPVSGPDFTDSVTPAGGNLSSVTRTVLEMSGLANTSATRYPVLLVDLAADTSFTITKWMLEPYNYGPYFDGSSDFGGFLYQQNYNDYAWSGSANASYSTYNVQRKKTQEAIKKVCSSIIPVNITFDPTSSTYLKFDWIPGKT